MLRQLQTAAGSVFREEFPRDPGKGLTCGSSKTTKARESPGPSYFLLRLSNFFVRLTGQERLSELYIHGMPHRLSWPVHSISSIYGVCGNLCTSCPSPEHGSCVCRLTKYFYGMRGSCPSQAVRICAACGIRNN